MIVDGMVRGVLDERCEEVAGKEKHLEFTENLCPILECISDFALSPVE